MFAGLVLLLSMNAWGADGLILGVPDWDQPADYGIAGYPAWCAPTSGAMVMGYWEDQLGMTGLADRQVCPSSPAYANRANDWRQGLWHDGTIEMGWFMHTDGWSMPNTQSPPTPYPYTGTLFVLDNIGPGLQQYAATGWIDPGGQTKLAFASAAVTSDSAWGQTMWNRFQTEVNAGRPVVCTFDNWIGTQQGTTTVKGQTIAQYSYGVTGAHTVCAVGYIDPTPTGLDGDEWIIAQDNWPTTPQYVAVPLQSSQWRLNDYLSLPTWPQQAKLTASDRSPSDFFGRSVSISGQWVIVGAYGDDDKGSVSGSAYMYQRNGEAWTQMAKITASDGAALNGFGQSVSVSGDLSIVGAPGHDNSGGSAYVYARNGTSWTETSKLSASDGAPLDGFAKSVAISGDFAVVGAYRADPSGSNSGSAYVYHRTGGTWNETKIVPSDGAAEDEFGASASISGSYAIIGANLDDDNGTDSGSAYIFERSGDAWSEVGKLIASDGAAGDEFGRSVAISGGFAVVGARLDDDRGTDSGSAYIFQRTEAGWDEVTKLTASDGASGDWFGVEVAISGDYAIVGSIYDDGDDVDSGSAYVFHREGSDWAQVDKLTASDGAITDYFGVSVAIDAGYAIVGAYGDDGHAGSAYVFTPEPGMVSLLVVGGLAILRRRRK